MRLSIPFSVLDLSYRSQGHTLVARWREQPGSDEEYIASYRQVLAAAVQRQCRFWLLDMRRCANNCPRLPQWLLQEFCPEVIASFRTSQQVYGAYLVFPSHVPYYTDIVLPTLAHPANTGYRAAAFIDEGLTTTWIRNQQ
ncbi:hypothetical protein [Hymenobacter fodinae]|uniref:Uncharacterized protein n=1 Tax=Hymenobacter fodinae TaxID=2510796 RepID=A0A4Z0P1W9_9BACT|nr:hypothetical protein [Hymenobacter fodinae]TGE03815.1 hypothetical protein EU556_24720 [Hymenobacter fodinae]